MSAAADDSPSPETRDPSVKGNVEDSSVDQGSVDQRSGNDADSNQGSVDQVSGDHENRVHDNSTATDSSTPRAQVAAAVKRERQRAGLSLSEVARRAGIGKSTMSGLEAGTANPSLETMWALAAALDIPLSRLLDPPQQEIALHHVRDMPSLPSTTANYVATLLSASPPTARRDIYFIQAEPGESRNSHPHPAGTIEHVIVGRGAARIEALGQSFELAAGDYLVHPGDQPHSFTALEPGTNCIFVVESR